MSILNSEINKIDPNSKIGQLYQKLYDSMRESGSIDSPDISEYVDEDGNVDEDGINDALLSFSDDMMKNAAYNNAKAIIEVVGEGDDGSIAVFTYTRTNSDITDEEAIAQALNKQTPKEGNIIIITDTNETQTYKYGDTGFIYNNSIWKPLNGRIDANNTIIRGDLILSGKYTSVGNITKSSENAVQTLETDGMSVMEVLNKIFSKVLEPIVTQPSISSFSLKANNSSGASSVEAGTEVYPYWSTVFNKGSYSYNDTNITVTDVDVRNSQNEKVGNALSGRDDSQVQISDSLLKYTIKINYSNGDIPNTNMGKPSSSVQPIQAGSLTSYATISGYRKLFYGYVGDENINNATIRNLTWKSNSGGTLDFVENKQMKAILIAAPKNTRNITKVVMPSSSNADVTTEFKKQATVFVSGANNYAPIEYDVWLYKPATMAGTYKVTIS